MGKTVLYIGNKLSTSKNNPTTHSSLEEGLKGEGFKVISASALKNKFLRLSHMLQVFFANYRRADYILIDVYSTQNFWYAVLLGRLSHSFSKKYIPILHGGDLKNRFRQTPGATSKLLGNAHRIISPSVYLKTEVENLGFSHVQYIPNPLRLNKYQFKKRENFEPKLLWVRAFDEIYNPLLALKTFRLLLKIYPEAELCMVGPYKDGSLAAATKYVKKHSLPVKFTGKLKKKEWLKLSAVYDIFINSSSIDNTPVSVIEAMALGLPVISTNVGGIPFLIEDGRTGLLVAPNDPEAMAKKILSLVEDPEKGRFLAENGRAKTAEFDWEIIKIEWSKVLT
ncbi:glycosyltransferase family 4 protein [Antarcticibacterium arcticum]|uniref:Glycosyltransferase family 4 protein n=1 Tax=Antarcticibacterium arcticum TaxID=2585771 RepID=A0A5B8YLQ8_9FLAO|nr:glycosyltransferase family 4 protein [Antarcticibacterium arcticum]QED37737.1 glycosyltransferase family 4 protein [Antarcticibacterium arcticum]